MRIRVCHACSEGLHLSCKGWIVAGGKIRRGYAVVAGKLIVCQCDHAS